MAARRFWLTTTATGARTGNEAATRVCGRAGGAICQPVDLARGAAILHERRRRAPPLPLVGGGSRWARLFTDRRRNLLDQLCNYEFGRMPDAQCDAMSEPTPQRRQ